MTRIPTVIITGVASGIGAGTARVCAAAGWQIVLVDCDESGLEQVAESLPVPTRCVLGDVGTAECAIAARDAALALGEGHIDAAIAVAGIMPHGPLAEFSHDEWQRVQRVNVDSVFLLAQHVLPVMAEAGGGAFVATSSAMASQTEPGYEAYTASKAAVIGLVKSLAVSYAKTGVRVNAISPGWVNTPMNDRLAQEMGGWEALRPTIERQQPTGEPASSEDIGQVAKFLASPESAAITGANIACDGAATAFIGG